MIPLQMELGGKDACIILEDGDLDLAAANIIKGGFSYRLKDFLSSQLPAWSVNFFKGVFQFHPFTRDSFMLIYEC